MSETAASAPGLPAAHAKRIGAERVIAVGRVLLSALALVTLLIDPTTPASHAPVSFALLAVFLGFGGLVLVLTSAWPTIVARHRLSLHVLDMVVFALLMYLTDGPNSPFFLFFSLSLVAAAMRWQWRGVAWTAVMVLATYAVVAWLAGVAASAPPIERDRFFVRTVYLAVLAFSLVYLGWYEAGLRGTLTTLARWSPVPIGSPEAVLASLLQHVSGLFDGIGVVLAWEDPDEPWSRLDTWIAQRHSQIRLSPVESQDLLPAAPDRAAADRADRGFPTADPVVDGRGVPVGPRAIPDAVRNRLGSGRILALDFRSAHTRGRLFLGRRRPFTADDLVTGRIAADRVATVLDYLVLRRRLKRVGARQERVRLSRDLHDGLLQSLTGAALQLEAVDRLWETEPAQARSRLRWIQRFIADEQRDLRFFIEGLRPGLTARRPPWNDELVALGERFRRVWGLAVEWSLPADEAGVPRKLRKQIHSLITEALSNSARHGRATEARVKLTNEDDRIDLTIADNGSGFPFEGRCTHEELERRGIGPASLKARIGALNGSLAIESGAGGALVEIELPTTDDAR